MPSGGTYGGTKITAIGRCDLVLREMDGYLTFKGVREIKPGLSRAYVRYVLGLHYKRSRSDAALPRMRGNAGLPTAIDPSRANLGSRRIRYESG